MEQLSLFDDRERTAPLASILRPDSLEDFVGQEHLVGKRKILRQLIERDQISSMIFWGPPGVGKNDSCKHYCRKDESRVCQFQRGDKWHQGDQRSNE